VLGTVSLAAVLALATGAALASADEQPTGPPVGPPRAVVKVTVIGDSFTSGEGADPATYRTVPVPATTEDGLTYESVQIDPAHQSSAAPTLQALNQIQAANPAAQIQVTFVPVSGATRDSLYQTTNPGTPFEQPPQINAVRGADVVIVGIGGNDAGFTNWVRTALSSTASTSAQQFPQFMQQFNDGTYLANQSQLLTNISELAAPNATIVSLGYPRAMPDTIPGSSMWWSPFSWSTISQNEANLSNQLATTLNANNQDAAFNATSQHPGQQWLYADVSTALQGHELFTSQEGLNGLTPSNTQGRTTRIPWGRGSWAA
jgi:lysophospholipase L1-like esterase